MSQALRQRRAHAARALATHPRRTQLEWDDLAAWPAWADASDGTDEPLAALALRTGALWHGASLRRCIHGPTLKQMRLLLGDAVSDAVMAGEPTADAAPEPPGPQHLGPWLQAEGAEVLLAAVPSPLLRLALRERHWPRQLPTLPPPDATRARSTVQRAMQPEAHA